MSTDNLMTVELPSLEHHDAWEAPILFDELETPDISAKLLPGIFGDYAAALANATETPEALSVMTILGVISTTISKHFFVSPKEGWNEPVNIYTLIALPPANNKSQVLKCCTKPLIEWEAEQALRLEPDIKRQRSERKTQEKIIEGLRIKASKSKGPIEQREICQEITEKEGNLIEIPTLPLLFTNDATPEALATLVHEQNGRLAIFSDEGGILETLAGLYSNGSANIDILLKGIDGGDVRVRRKDRSFTINPYLTIVLTVQPAIIHSISEKRTYTGNGSLERFLYVLPKSKLGFRTHSTTPLSTMLQSAYHTKIKQLLDSYSQYHNQEPTKSHTLSLQPPAASLWRDFQATIERHLRPESKFAPCLGWAGKISGFALRLAGLLHIAEFDLQHSAIRESTMANALSIAFSLTEHALEAFNLMGLDQSTNDAKSIYQWINTHIKNSFTQSDIVLAMRNKKLGKPERLSKALLILQTRNIISSPVKLPTRKPTTLYYVNPLLPSGEKPSQHF